MSDTLEEVACDGCGRRDARFRYTLDRSTLVTCRGCGLTFVTPRWPEAVLEAKLQQWAVLDTVDDARLRIAFEPTTMRLYAGYVAELTRRLGRPGRLLDVGCSTGAFLTAARDGGWDVQGLEIGNASADYARRNRGLDVLCGSLYDHDGAPAEFDAIVCLEVVEHLPSPSSALRRMQSWLKPGGLLLLSTPNFDALYRRLFGTRWWVINCEDEHITLFTPRTLARMVGDAGFDVVESRTRSIDYAGLWHQFRAGRRTAALPGPDGHGYYDARGRKTELKRLLGRLGLLTAARAALGAQDRLLALPGAPALGEQIVTLARRPGPGA